MKIVETALRAALLAVAVILATVVVSATSNDSPLGGLCILMLTIATLTQLAWRLVFSPH
jgi:hypothetical protein